MNLSRRGFFATLAAGAVALAASSRLSSIVLEPIKQRWLILHIDGINDDGPAINAFMRNEPVMTIDGTLVDGDLLPAGRYMSTETIIMASFKRIENSAIIFRGRLGACVRFPNDCAHAQLIKTDLRGDGMQDVCMSVSDPEDYQRALKSIVSSPNHETAN